MTCILLQTVGIELPAEEANNTWVGFAFACPKQYVRSKDSTRLHSQYHLHSCSLTSYPLLLASLSSVPYLSSFWLRKGWSPTESPHDAVGLPLIVVAKSQPLCYSTICYCVNLDFSFALSMLVRVKLDNIFKTQKISTC